MPATLRAAHSTPTADSVAEILAPYLGSSRVRYHCRGLTDVFTVGDEYFARVYPANWRTDAEIRWEVALLRHLDEQGAPVATPVALGDADFLTVDAPEGPRRILILNRLHGRELRGAKVNGRKVSAVTVPGEYGAGLARVHAAADSFDSGHSRFELDAENLLRRPLRNIIAIMDHRLSDAAWLTAVVARLEAKLAAHGREDWGPCHGDASGSNAVLDGRRVSFFDFDCGGYGPRAYDLAGFAWGLHVHGHDDPEAQLAGFLNGYRTIRPLSARTVDAIGLMCAIREVWFLGLFAAIGDRWGHNQIDDDFLDSRLDRLAMLCQRGGVGG